KFKDEKVLARLGEGALERVLARAPEVDQMKGQLLEELLGARFSGSEGRVAREALAGKSALKAASKAGSEIEFIPGHLIRDAEGKIFTDGVLAYREGDRLHVVALFESKAGKASAQKLKRAWKAMPEAGTAEWHDLRKDAIAELQERFPALEKKLPRELDKSYAK